MSFEVGTSYSAQSVPYTVGNALCCCKDSANLCNIAVQSLAGRLTEAPLQRGDSNSG